MISASTGFQTLLSGSSRHFLARILKNGSVVDCDIKKMRIYKGACGDSTLTIGSVYSSYAELTIDGLVTLLENEDITIQIGMTVSGSDEYLTVGKFTVNKIKSSVYESEITAVGFISSKLAVDLPARTTQSIPAIVDAISNATGLTISLSGVTAAGTITEPLTSMTCRAALELVTFLLGAYATETADGNIRISKYQIPVSKLAVDGDRMLSFPKFADIAFTMTGVKVIAFEESYDDEGELIPEVSYETATTVRQIYQNKYMTAAMFEVFKNNVVGYTYMPGEVDLSLGDPRLEPWDCLAVTDINSNTVNVPCLQIVHEFDGGLSTSIVATGAAETDNAPEGYLTKQLNQVNSELVKAQDGAAKAIGAAAAAQASANAAAGAASAAQASANAASGAAASAQADATAAQGLAEAAETAARGAIVDAGNASAYANTALGQLGVVEDIVGVLDFITKEGTYERTNDTTPQDKKWYFERTGSAPYVYVLVNNISEGYFLTEDTVVVPDKTYYTRSGTAPNYTYTEVANPVDSGLSNYYELTNSPHLHGYYELTGVEAAIKNFLSSRLVVTGQGLWIQDPSMQTRILLSPTNGIELYGTDGLPVAKYGETAMIGKEDGFHIEIDGEELGFYQTRNVKVAYIRNNQLFIPRSVVLEQMDLGLPDGSINPSTGERSYGQWSWKLHRNGQSPSRNNLNLKWIG